MKSAKQILIDARKIIENPENWTRYGYARDANGECVSVNNKQAISYCAVGACMLSLGGIVLDQPSEFSNALSRLQSFVPKGEMSTYNDDPKTTHEDVLEKFDLAIASFGEDT